MSSVRIQNAIQYQRPLYTTGYYCAYTTAMSPTALKQTRQPEAIIPYGSAYITYCTVLDAVRSSSFKAQKGALQPLTAWGQGLLWTTMPSYGTYTWST